jgi:hypothetical protein
LFPILDIFAHTYSSVFMPVIVYSMCSKLKMQQN